METKIIATIGPVSESRKVLSQLIDAGLDIARFNFSHARYKEVRARTKKIRDLNAEKKTSVAILQDLCGPRIRVGHIDKGGKNLRNGQEVTFYTNNAPKPKSTEIPINDPFLHNDLKPGDHILIEGGRFDCLVEDVDRTTQRIKARVLRGGLLISNKGINLPYVRLTTSSPTDKDKEDAILGKKLGFEYVALSFVQSAQNIHDLREILSPDQKIIAKIEDPLGIENIDEIIEACDGIMIGRGDLGVELPIEQVPIVQKQIIAKCKKANKPSIVATQALMSMIYSPFPTRAEVSDVANAVIDGADSVMLSDETATGKYPVEAVETLVRVVRHTEVALADPETRKSLQVLK